MIRKHYGKENRKLVDKLGVPAMRRGNQNQAGRNIVNFDPYFTAGLTNITAPGFGKLVRRLDTDPMSGINQSLAPFQIPERQLRKAGIPDRQRMSSISERGFTGKICRPPRARFNLRTSCFITRFTARQWLLRPNPALTATPTCACRT